MALAVILVVVSMASTGTRWTVAPTTGCAGLALTTRPLSWVDGRGARTSCVAAVTTPAQITTIADRVFVQVLIGGRSYFLHVQDDLQPAVQTVVVGRHPVLELIVDADPRVPTDLAQIAHVEGPHVVAEHGIAVERVEPAVDLVAVGQAHGGEHRTAGRLGTRAERRGELRLQIEERGRAVAGHELRAHAEAAPRPLRVGAKEIFVVVAGHALRQQLAANLRRDAGGETGAREHFADPTVEVHAAITVGEEAIAVEGAEEQLEARGRPRPAA